MDKELRQGNPKFNIKNAISLVQFQFVWYQLSLFGHWEKMTQIYIEFSICKVDRKKYVFRVGLVAQCVLLIHFLLVLALSRYLYMWIDTFPHIAFPVYVGIQMIYFDKPSWGGKGWKGDGRGSLWLRSEGFVSNWFKGFPIVWYRTHCISANHILTYICCS